MRITKGRVIGSLLTVALVIGLVLSMVILRELTKKPNPYDPAYIESEAGKFLLRAATNLLPGQKYESVETAGPVKGWLVLTVAFTDETWGKDIGSGGLVAIGRPDNVRWAFRLPSDQGFGDWVKQSPTSLLPESLREWYEESKGESTLPSGPTAFPLLAQETIFNLPYREGERYILTTTLGKGHHSGNHRFALDFGLPEGTQIVASSNGKVVALRDGSGAGGCSPRFDPDANFIMTQLPTGDFLLYLHILKNSAQEAGMYVGREVKAGEIIAKSGSTGFTCGRGGGRGAHLHIERGTPCSNLQRICESRAIRFAEFEPIDPRQQQAYTSQNFSPEKRRELKRAAEIGAIEDALDKFHIVYTCSTLKSCNRSDVITSWVTQGMVSQLFPEFSFCLFCGGGEKWDTNKLLEEGFFQGFPSLEAFEEGKVEVVENEMWLSTRGDNTYRHFTVVSHFLVKEGGLWKVDSYTIPCGYAVEEGSGEVVWRESLQGCFWQPPEGLGDGSTHE